GGAGKYRGGLSTRKVYRFLNPASVVLISDRGVRPPYGLFGGKDGRPTRFILVKESGEEIYLKTRTDQIHVGRNDKLIVEAPGSGGVGNPAERSSELIAQDILNGYVSPESAEKDYGYKPNPQPPRVGS
ncbi:MAG: hydantoinase B/oxoprolinase family protein, partial [Nitrososphaerota archaeon]|nr:hydantoinase B/oxoprolinase family protein [Nitrososphaerota archaeon]